MSWPVLAWLSVIAVSTTVQIALAIGFMRSLRRWRRPLLADSECRPAIVVLCLRGEDPFLRACIQGLVSQDYPQFRVHFLLDHPSDPSVAVVQSVLSETGFPHAIVEVLGQPRETCSLKCSALVQAIEMLPSDVHFVAQLDADTVPHRSWLRELATALAPEHVGAVNGNRWYMPNRISWGALVRYLWNAAAVVQMYWYKIPWGGSMAVKVSAIRAAGLTDLWRRSFCEDTMLRKQLGKVGLRVEFVPSLMMVNREDCSLRSFFSWVTRQLLAARLYHPAWLMVVLHGLSGFALLLIGWGWGIVELFLGHFGTAWPLLIAMAAYQIVLAIMMPLLESAVAQVVRGRGEDTSWISRLSAWKVFWAIVLTQIVYTLALVKSLLLRRVDWRGITYQINGPWSIRMLGYQPYLNGAANSAPRQYSL